MANICFIMYQVNTFFGKNRNFGRKSKFFDKNRNIGQKSKFLTKIEILVENRNFLTKIEISYYIRSRIRHPVTIGSPLEVIFISDTQFPFISMTPFFRMLQLLCTKFDPLNDFSKRRASQHLKAQEFQNLQAFEFFKLLTKFSFKLKLEFRN